MLGSQIEMEPFLVLGDEEVLRLDADVEDVAVVPGGGEHTLEVLPGAVHVRLVVDVEVGGQAGDSLGPGRDAVGVEVDAGHHVVGVRALAKPLDGGASEPGALDYDVFEVVGGHHLDFWRPVYVDELDEEILDLVILDALLDLFQGRHRGLLRLCNGRGVRVDNYSIGGMGPQAKWARGGPFDRLRANGMGRRPERADAATAWPR